MLRNGSLLTRSSLFAAVALVSTVAAAPAQEAGLPIGAVASAQGSARAQQGAVVRALRADDAVLFQDRLATGQASGLAVTLDDDSRITLGEDATLSVDRFVYDPRAGRKAGALAIGVLRGAFLFVGGKIEERKGATVTIRTSAATLGVRGTTVWGGPIDGGFGVFVIEGRVSVRAPGGTVTLTRGQGTLIDTAGRADRPSTWGQPRIERAFAQVPLAAGRGPAPGGPALQQPRPPSAPAGLPPGAPAGPPGGPQGAGSANGGPGSGGGASGAGAAGRGR